MAENKFFVSVQISKKKAKKPDKSSWLGKKIQRQKHPADDRPKKNFWKILDGMISDISLVLENQHDKFVRKKV